MAVDVPAQRFTLRLGPEPEQPDIPIGPKAPTRVTTTSEATAFAGLGSSIGRALVQPTLPAQREAQRLGITVMVKVEHDHGPRGRHDHWRDANGRLSRPIATSKTGMVAHGS